MQGNLQAHLINKLYTKGFPFPLALKLCWLVLRITNIYDTCKKAQFSIINVSSYIWLGELEEYGK